MADVSTAVDQDDAEPAAPSDLATAAPVRSRGRVFGVTTLALFSFGFIANVNSVPPMATYGLGCLTFYAITVLFLLGPTALTSSELGAAFPASGGIYVWVREALGEKWGFLTIWLEFAAYTIALPVVMTTIANTAAYAFDPSLVSNQLFSFVTILVAIWVTAFISLRGLKVVRNLNIVAVIAGNLIPAAVIVVLAIVWLAQGKGSATPITAAAVVPDLSQLSNLVFATSAFLMFAGIEICGMHASEVREPGRTIPRANGMTALLCVLLFVPVTLAVAVVVPSSQLNVAGGFAEAMSDFLEQFDLGGLVPVFAVMLVAGLSIAVVEIFGSASRGLAVSAADGNLPPRLDRVNKGGMATLIVLAQAGLGSLLSLLFLLLPTVQNAWWALEATQTMLILGIYVMMYVSVVRLRRTRPDVARPFRIPGGKVGLYLVTGGGGLACLIAIGLDFIPPSQLQDVSFVTYAGSMLIAVAVILAVPFIVRSRRRPSWLVRTEPDA